MTPVSLAENAGLEPLPPIVCFSHLGWDTGLFQRPQQLMLRLAQRDYRIYYFACIGQRKHREQPMAGAVDGQPGLHVYTLPYAPSVKKFAGLRRWLAGLRVASILAREGVRKPVLWFYHPSLFALGYSHSDSAIVYDIMDHFPSFESSVDDLYFDELGLLAETDIVFTGGRSLDGHARNMMDILVNPVDDRAGSGRGKKRELPCPVMCYPSGVDLDHFSQNVAADCSEDSVAAGLPSPRFGYFGAIDERIDWEIIRKLADATAGSVILAGPTLRDVPDELPANVHLPGSVDYARLPQLLGSFDVCLIPFRRSPLVDFVSPTKTPEYLAGGKPVVSTAIPDVVMDFGEVVSVAKSAEDFVAACLNVAADPPSKELLTEAAKERARTWDQIALEMDIHLRRVIAGEKGCNDGRA